MKGTSMMKVIFKNHAEESCQHDGTVSCFFSSPFLFITNWTSTTEEKCLCTAYQKTPERSVHLCTQRWGDWTAEETAERVGGQQWHWR